MLSNKLQAAFNDQIQKEMYSAHLYLAMAAVCEAQSLKGFASWLRIQYEEELSHALKLYDYMLERGGNPLVPAIAAPPAEFGTIEALFATVLAHEQQVTAAINKLYEVAIAETDYAAQVFLQWFITEQVEEESSAGEIVERLRMLNGASLLYLDRELAQRERE